MDSAIVIKVKHAKTLRRFNARVVNNGLELTLDGLRNKIRGLFNFSPDADFVLTYVDEDNDKVTLGDDEDLRDVVRQSLDPLRIFVSLRTDDVARTPSETESVTRTPNTSVSDRTLLGSSAPVQNPAQNAFEKLNSSFIEFINSIPEPINKRIISSLPEPLANGVTKVLSDIASTGTSQGLSEVVQLLIEKGLPFPRQPSESGAATDSSVQASSPATKNSLTLGGAQEAGSSDVQKSVLELLSKEKRVKFPSEVVTEAQSAAKSNGVPGNQATETNEVVKSGGLKESAVSPPGQKGEKDAQKEKAISEEKASVGKATKSSPVVGAPTISSPMLSIKKKDFNMPQVPKPIEGDDPSEKAKKSPWFASPSVTNSIPLVNSGDSFKKHTEPPKPVQGFPFPAAPGFKTWNKGQPNTFNYPSSPAPQCPFLGTAGPYSRRSYGYTDGSGTIFHRGVRCDGCGVHPITGTRFKSVVKDDYDLCSICFAQMGLESDYMRIDRPTTFHNPPPPYNPSATYYNPPATHHNPTRAPSFTPPGAYRSQQPSSLFDSYCGNLSRPKLDSRFIQDVTILDNALMAPSTPFTKIWRMRNNGSLQWPWGTKLVWIGGDKMGDVFSVDLEIGGTGFPVDQELDVAVDFVAPDRPGRYVSYWRMRSPTGQKFGQRVWVLIQVDATLTAVQQALRDFNLNHMPSNTPGGSAPEEVLEDAEPLEDNAVDLVKPGLDLSSSTEKKEDTVFPINDNLLVGSSTAQPPSEAPRVSYPMIDLSDAFPSRPSGGTSTFVAPPFNDGSDQTTTEFVPPAQKPVTVDSVAEESNAAPVAIPFPAAPELLVDASDEQTVQAEGEEKNDLEKRFLMELREEENALEKSLLMELDRMGFKEVDLNKEILRSNKYDLEKALNDLCGESEWDPILEELHEMGFHDDVMNKKLLEKNKGSVTQVVLDLLVEEGQ